MGYRFYVSCVSSTSCKTQSYLKPLTKGGVAGHLKDDIHTLQSCRDQATFIEASALFLKKWRTTKDSRVLDVDYFDKEWQKKYPNWYEGAAENYPSTNNALEATNGVIKKEHTLRERLPVGQFLNCMAEMVKKWSEARDSSSINCVLFAETKSVSLKMWTSAYHWALSTSPMLQHDEESRTQHSASPTHPR